MPHFLDALRSGRVLLMDGAMGTELQRAGLQPSENAATWNVFHPDRVEAVHRQYLRSGAEVLLTNSFLVQGDTYQFQVRGSRRGSGYPAHWCEALARTGEGDHFRLAAMGPVSGPLVPEFANLKQFGPPLHDCGNPVTNLHSRHPSPDATLLETCSTPRARFAVQHIRKWATLPVLLSLTYLRNPAGEIVTASGHSPEWFAERAGNYGVAALGVNCGRDIGMDEIIEIVRRYRRVTDLPLFARPNAGTPTREDDRWVYPHTPEMMAARLPELLEAGVSMVGGCCGTTPEHIAAFRPLIDRWNSHR